MFVKTVPIFQFSARKSHAGAKINYTPVINNFFNLTQRDIMRVYLEPALL